jgi:methylenetetrahydrofolate dehydrogenase (NAD+)
MIRDQILEHLDVYDRALEIGDQLKGKTITIVNRSEVVGRPLAALLANDGAKVYSVDVHDVLEFHRGDKQMKHYVSDTHFQLEDVLCKSDVVITGVPGSSFKIPTAQLKKGVIAINFSSQNNFTEDVVDRAKMYVPSIGKVTIAMLQRNLLRLYNYQLQHRACTDKMLHPQ